VFFFILLKAFEDILNHSQIYWLNNKYGERSELLLSTEVYDQVVQQHVLCTREVHSSIHRKVLLTPVIAHPVRTLRPALFKIHLNVVLPPLARYPDELCMCMYLSDVLLDTCYILRSCYHRSFIPHGLSQRVVWSTNYVIFCPRIYSLKAASILRIVCFRTTSLCLHKSPYIRLRFKVLEAVLLVLESPGMTPLELVNIYRLLEEDTAAIFRLFFFILDNTLSPMRPFESLIGFSKSALFFTSLSNLSFCIY